jgi:hypothetical protein
MHCCIARQLHKSERTAVCVQPQCMLAHPQLRPCSAVHAVATHQCCSSLEAQAIAETWHCRSLPRCQEAAAHAHHLTNTHHDKHTAALAHARGTTTLLD